MFGFLKDKFEKEAQAAIERRARQMAPHAAPPSAKAPATAPQAASGREQAIARMQGQAKGLMTPERQALIAQAMAVHKAKQKIFADLDDESRAKLVAMAITTLLHQGDPDDKTRK